jgi:tetratricopeptide (TPR) repeat protein
MTISMVASMPVTIIFWVISMQAIAQYIMAYIYKSNGDTMKNMTSSICIYFFFLSTTALANGDPWQTSYTLETQGNYAGASQALESVIQTNSRHEFATMRLGWLAYLQKDYNVSIDHYKKAVELNTNSLDAKLGIMLPLMAQGRWKEAASYGETVLKLAPYQYYAHIRLMACEEARLQWNALYKHAQNISKYYPTDATIAVYLARAASVTGETKVAIKAYEDVLERSPGHLEAIRFLSMNKK